MGYMQGAEQAISYEEVAAYEANGIELYGLPSGGTATGSFVVSWDLEKGFSGHGWNDDNSASPAYGWTKEMIENDAADGNLNDMFAQWAQKVSFQVRLNWVTEWMNNNGCVSEI